MTVQLIQFCPSLQLLQSLFQNIAHEKGTWHRDEWPSLESILQKKLNFLRINVDPIQPKNFKISKFHFDLSLKFSQGEVHEFSGEVQKFSRDVQNDLRRGQRCAPPHTFPQNAAMPKARCAWWSETRSPHIRQRWNYRAFYSLYRYNFTVARLGRPVGQILFGVTRTTVDSWTLYKRWIICWILFFFWLN